MLLHPNCIFTIRIAMTLQEILLKFGGELGANLWNFEFLEFCVQQPLCIALICHSLP